MMECNDDMPWDPHEFVKICESMEPGESFYSPKGWPSNVHRYKDCWILILKSEKRAREQNVIGVVVKTPKAMLEFLIFNRKDTVEALPLEKEIVL